MQPQQLPAMAAQPNGMRRTTPVQQLHAVPQQRYATPMPAAGIGMYAMPVPSAASFVSSPATSHAPSTAGGPSPTPSTNHVLVGAPVPSNRGQPVPMQVQHGMPVPMPMQPQVTKQKSKRRWDMYPANNTPQVKTTEYKVRGDPRPPVHPEDWVQNFVHRIWPDLTDFLGNKMKTNLRARRIYVDEAVNRTCRNLAENPPCIPMTKDWVNEVIFILWPMLRKAISAKIHGSIVPLLRERLPSMFQSIDLDPCDIGSTPPKITKAEVMPDYMCGGFMDIKIGLEFDGKNSNIELVYKGMKAGIKSIQLDVTLYVSLYKKTDEPPFFEGASMYMPKSFDFNIGWSGLVTFLDSMFMEDLLHNVVQDSVRSLCVLPNRIPVLLNEQMGGRVFELSFPKPRGVLLMTLMECQNLRGEEMSINTLLGGGRTCDPAVTIRIGPQKWKSPTVNRNNNPQWENTNQHLFFVDIPEQQVVDIRVFDEDYSTAAREKVTGQAADLIARALNLSIPGLLGTDMYCQFNEEIKTDMWIPLDSWWPGRGTGPESVLWKAKEEAEAKVEAEFVSASPSSAAEAPPLPAAPKAKAKGKESPERSGSFMNRMWNWAKDEAQEAGHWIKEEAEYVAHEASHLAHTVVDEVTEGIHWVSDSIHEHYEKQAREYKESLLAQGARVRVKFHFCPVAFAMDHERPPPPKKLTTTNRPTLECMLEEAPTVRVPKAIHGVDDDGAILGRYILMVGIHKVDRVILSDEGMPECQITCDCTPLVTEDGRYVTESEDGVTLRKSPKVTPDRASVSGLQQSTEDSKLMARKIALLAQRKVPVETIADVLDISSEQVFSALAGALAESERSDCIDVVFDHAFLYLLHDPMDAVIELEAWRNGESLGKQKLQIGPLMHKYSMIEDFERLPLNGVEHLSRLTGRVQLWPIVKKSKSFQQM
eukprot:TRINITY_DN11101_c0_g1_i2.p1 TRINITY_DN11101_c0_g1~~TRINITY_DN11101_c0_g1_i2.p1  ORF type:complete len:930 (-),score=142.80 TRINITY_DN11101_c0_g1_i2:66-2855(-)